MKLLLVFSLLTVSVAARDWPPHPSCPCGRIYMPVCASNDATYNNICEFECAQRHLRKSGVHIYVERQVFLCLLSINACLAQWTGFAEKDCVCTSQYDPVCGSDRRRYYNICKYDCRLEYIRRHGLPMIEKIDCKLLPPPAPIH